MNTTVSDKMFEKAKEVIPGGVNSPVRACKSVGRNPIFIQKAKGSKVYDIDGNEYIDFVCSWGPMIHGHAPDEIIDAVKEAADDSTSFGAPTTKEMALASMVVDAVPDRKSVV